MSTKCDIVYTEKFDIYDETLDNTLHIIIEPDDLDMAQCSIDKYGVEIVIKPNTKTHKTIYDLTTAAFKGGFENEL